jgi:hypothetical protein
MPADLRDALRQACDLAETLYTEFTALERVRLDRVMVDASGVPEHLERLRSLADQPEPPGVMTVAEALALPQVRDGSHWIEWTPRLCREMQFRFHPSSKQFDARPKDGDWQRVALVALSDLDAPCTLISSQGGAR